MSHKPVTLSGSRRAILIILRLVKSGDVQQSRAVPARRVHYCRCVALSCSRHLFLVGNGKKDKGISGDPLFNPHHTGEWLKRSDNDGIMLLNGGFNPHRTGEWLKSSTSAKKSWRTPSFQSSSYWRMAEKGETAVQLLRNSGFQSSSYWRMAEKKSPFWFRKEAQRSFNPHHTGEWLKSGVEIRQSIVLVPFQSSSYWRMAEKQLVEPDERFPARRFQSSSYWRMAEKLGGGNPDGVIAKVSILIILANG